MRFKDTSYYVALGKAQEQLRTVLATNKLEAENARLRAELEALRPKPVVTIDRYPAGDGEILVTFHDNKPVKAEVLEKV